MAAKALSDDRLLLLWRNKGRRPDLMAKLSDEEIERVRKLLGRSPRPEISTGLDVPQILSDAARVTGPELLERPHALPLTLEGVGRSSPGDLAKEFGIPRREQDFDLSPFLDPDIQEQKSLAPVSMRAATPEEIVRNRGTNLIGDVALGIARGVSSRGDATDGRLLTKKDRRPLDPNLRALEQVIATKAKSVEDGLELLGNVADGIWSSLFSRGNAADRRLLKPSDIQLVDQQILNRSEVEDESNLIRDELDFQTALAVDPVGVAEKSPHMAALGFLDRVSLGGIGKLARLKHGFSLVSEVDELAEAAIKAGDTNAVTTAMDALDGISAKAERAGSDLRQLSPGDDSIGARARDLDQRAQAAKEAIAEGKAPSAERQIKELEGARRSKKDQESIDRAKAQQLDLFEQGSLDETSLISQELSDVDAASKTGRPDLLESERTQRAIRKQNRPKHPRRSLIRSRKTRRERGAANPEILTRMAGTALGSSIGVALTADEEGFGIGTGIIAGGALGFLLGTPKMFRGRRFQVEGSAGDILGEFIDPKKARKLAESTKGARVVLDAVDFEETLGILKKLLPDREFIIGRDQVRDVATVIGGAMGAATLSGIDQEIPAPARFGLGLLGFGAGAGIARSGIGKVRPGRINPRREYERWFEQFGELPKELRPVAEKAMTRHRVRVAEMADVVFDLQKAPTEARAIIHDFLNGTVAAEAIPERWRDAAVAMRFHLDDLAVQLVELGAAQGKLAETMLDNLGTYVPRLYLAFSEGDAFETVAKYLRDQGQPITRISDEDYFKKRQNLPEEVRKAWGEINRDNPDPGYILGKRGPVTSQDIANHEFINYVAASPDFSISSDLITAGRKSAKAAGDLFSAATDADLPRLFKRSGPRGGSVDHAHFNGRVFRQLPNSRRYGRLAGRFVDEDVADYLQGINEINEGTWNFFNEAVFRPGTALFKASKVTFNPATLIRNWIGQLPLMDFAGVSPFRPWEYLPSFSNYLKKNDQYLRAREAGLFGSEWFGEEVGSLLRQVDKEGKTLGGGVLNWIAEGSSSPFRKMRQFHEASEQIHKQIIFDHATQRLGMSAADAVRYAHRYAFNYQDVSKFVNWSRRSPFGAPFISFSYKAMPRVIEQALGVGNPRQALKFWKYPAGLAAANEASSRMLGDVADDDKGLLSTTKRLALNTFGLGVGKGTIDDKGFQEFLPGYSGSQQVLFPYRDNFGRRRYVDATYWLPWGDIGEVGKGTLGTSLARMGVPFPRQLEPSNPWMQMWTAVWFGRNPFTGKQIIPAGSTPMDAMLRQNDWITQQFGPQLFGFQSPKILAAATGEVASRPDQPDLPTSVMEMFGVRIKPNDPRTGADWQIRELERLERDLTFQQRRLDERGGSKRSIKNLERRILKTREKIRKLIERRKELPETPKLLTDAFKSIRSRGNERIREVREELAEESP